MKGIINRNYYLQKLIEWQDTELIKIITGVRRSGKSTLLEQFATHLTTSSTTNQVIYLNFEDLQHLELHNYKKLHDYCKQKLDHNDGKTYFLFDEIQLVPQWEKTVNSLRLQKKADIYITGSNANILSAELATLLSGRYISMQVLPFSFAEAREFDNSINIQNYMKLGSFPGVINLQTEQQKWTYLQDLTDSILYKDVLLRNKIDDAELLKNICSFMYDTVGNLISVRKITNKLVANGSKTKQETVSKYLESIIAAHLLYEVQRYDIKGKEILTRNPKYYGVDTGIRTVLASPTSENIGSVIENIVFLELIRRGYQVYVGTYNNLEIDFVATKSGEPIYIQVAMSAIDETTAAREFAPLLAIKDNYPKYVITLDSFDLSRQGIKHINLEKFLMN